ncbi:MAG: hypothetical protein RJQ09_07165 [Cyclobacteriaceae bacterium]
MKKNEQLFYLVKSLSRSEKRYFRLFIKGYNNSETAYLSIFEFIEKQPEPNDAEIKKHFKDEQFCNQLHVIKNYLTRLIMKSLRNCHDSKSKSFEVKELLKEAELLIQRELFDLATTTIKKAIRVAQKYDRLELLIEAFKLKRQIIQSTRGTITARAQIKELLEAEKQAIGELANINEFQNLSYSFMEPELSANGNKILEQPIMKVSSRKSLQSKIYYQHIRYAAFSFSNRQEKGLEAIQELIELLEATPHRIKEDPRSYITALNNKIGALLHARKLDDVPGLLRKIRQVPEKFKMPPTNYTLKTFLSTYNVELELYRDTKQWDRGIQSIHEISDFIAGNVDKISAEHQVTFNYQIAYIFFMSGDNSKSLKSLNENISGNFGEVRKDILVYSRLLYLMIHFQLKNIIVLKYAIVSTRRFLQKSRQMQSFEKVLLKFLGRICTTPESSWRDHFLWLNDNLFLKTSDEDKAQILDYLDFEDWIERHLGLEAG